MSKKVEVQDPTAGRALSELKLSEEARLSQRFVYASFSDFGFDISTDFLFFRNLSQSFLGSRSR